MTTVDFEPLSVAVPLWEDPPGVFRVGNSRVLLELVIRAFQRGETAEGIVQAYRSLHLADVYALFSRYLGNPTPFDEYLRQCDQQAEAIRREIEASQPAGVGKEELLAQGQGQGVGPVISFLVDQNFNEHIVDGLRRRQGNLDLVHVRDVGLSAAPDPTMLAWAATQGRVLLTHDRKTIPPFAHARTAAGLPMPGVFLVSTDMPIGQAIDEILVAVYCLSPKECKDIVKYFPL